VLRAIPAADIAAKQAAIAAVWRMVTYPKPAHEDDAFHAILRELGRKRRLLKTSARTQWS
jgi:hypothetical protein